MPLICVLAIRGSPRCFLYRAARLSLNSTLLFCTPVSVNRTSTYRPKCSWVTSAALAPPHVTPHRRSQASDSTRELVATSTPIRYYTSSRDLPEDEKIFSASVPGSSVEESDTGHTVEPVDSNNAAEFGFQPLLGRKRQKALRPSRPAMLLDSIIDSSRDLYATTPPRRKDISYVSPRDRLPGGRVPRTHNSPAKWDGLQPRTDCVSFYTILARRLRTLTATVEVEFELSREESLFLHSNGYTQASVDLWAYSLLTRPSVTAARIFTTKHELPPLFLALLFLRRKRIRALALGVIMRHIRKKLQKNPVTLNVLQLIATRLLRHARHLWPESIPWIASLYVREAKKIYDNAKKTGRLNPPLVSNLTHLSNTMLSLLSLPATIRPMLSSLHQEKAQFEILQFMATCKPALVMTRDGFRATTRNQLAHAKTSQEKLWAILKGPSWPPWKENRNSMDEEKGYDFGASRASQIMHRMYEAGYEGNNWEKMAEIYAGWDTDLSPTIQTRTLLPHISTYAINKAKLRPLLWAARIRTTRTRREAWACFLAYEASNEAASPEAYLAMFEKLYYPEVEEHEHNIEDIPSSTGELEYSREDAPSSAEEQTAIRLLPGDMKEVIPEASSPLHHVYLNEPLPTYEQLYHRMVMSKVRPGNKFIAFLLDTFPDLSGGIELLEASDSEFPEGLQTLISHPFPTENKTPPVPEYLLGSFIRFLCRFGRSSKFSGPPSSTPMPALNDPNEHYSRLKSDQSYIVDYAFALLMHYKPAYNPAWTAYMRRVRLSYLGLSGRSHAMPQYHVICDLFETMNDIDLDPDDDQFQILCYAAGHAARAAYNGLVPADEANQMLSTAPRFLRTIFHSLVGADIDPNDLQQTHQDNAIQPHIPDVSALHTYARTLSMLRDYEGLYSLSTWMTAHNAQVTARANAQHSGAQALFKTLVALRAGLEGTLGVGQGLEGASQELIELIKAQIESVEEWGWPADEHVAGYLKGARR